MVSRLIGDTEADNLEDGGDGILPADLLTLFVSAARIGDADFLDPDTAGAGTPSAAADA